MKRINIRTKKRGTGTGGGGSGVEQWEYLHSVNNKTLNNKETALLLIKIRYGKERSKVGKPRNIIILSMTLTNSIDPPLINNCKLLKRAEQIQTIL